jgi:hypothetical protein
MDRMHKSSLIDHIKVSNDRLCYDKEDENYTILKVISFVFSYMDELNVHLLQTYISVDT